MAELAEIRTAIAASLAPIPVLGTRARAYVPNKITPPTGFVHPLAIDFDTTMARGADYYTLGLTVCVSTAMDRTSQENLDAYCASSGSLSVKATLERFDPANPTENPIAAVLDWLTVKRIVDYGWLEITGVTYLGARFELEMMANG